MYMDNKSLVLMAAKACDEKKAKDIKLIKIDKVSFISEWILIAEGLSDVQVRSITNSVEGELRDKAKIEPIRKEGVNEAKWALLDYGDLIVNILISLNILNKNKIKEYRGIVLVSCFIFGMIFTPPDVISQILLAVPMYLLFELGLLFSNEKKKKSNS